MDGNTKYILDRIERLRDELRQDMEKIALKESQSRMALDARVRRIEGFVNKTVGGSLAVSAFVGWLSKHI